MSEKTMHAGVFNADRLSARLATNEAYWRRDSAARPLLGVAVNVTFPAVRFAKLETGEGRLTAEGISPEAFPEDWDRSFEQTEDRAEDFFMVASPCAAVPWMEAIGDFGRASPERASR